ncbi:MAG: nucleotidyl transferase AbiEii/AbiGii toxin family protein [Acidobacteriota bacterium]|nr:nucleotidyl transferase AbiEii/AbiGii toxin family protein [Acidobacteriota bacterium]
MNRIAQLTRGERADIFAETADRKRIADAIVEKDFWVCWLLQQIFSIDVFANRLLFKGGTSLSKIFHAINRFSEDVDLAVDYAALGFIGDRDPRQQDISNTKRNHILAEMMVECQRYIGGEFLHSLKLRCDDILGKGGGWSLDVSGQDPNVVRFIYPTGSMGNLPYVNPQVVLELGTHAELVPHDSFTIRTFVAEEFPALFSDIDIGVVALLAKRTFWEKATILHAEYYRPPEKPFPERYSRHYYDTAMMADGPIGVAALADMTLLDQVVRHKKTFYPAAWSRYDLARPGSLHTLPAENRIAALESDYRQMGVMIFGEPLPFEAIIRTLAELENRINA